MQIKNLEERRVVHNFVIKGGQYIWRRIENAYSWDGLESYFLSSCLLIPPPKSLRHTGLNANLN